MEVSRLIVEFGILTICIIQLFLMVGFITKCVKDWGVEEEEHKRQKKKKLKKGNNRECA